MERGSEVRLNELEIARDFHEEQKEKHEENKSHFSTIEHHIRKIIESDKRINYEEKHITKNKLITWSFYLFGAFAFLLFITLFFQQSPRFIGFVTQENTHPVNLIFSESSSYEFNIPESGSLESIKISGYTEGEGNAQIYLDDKLVLDTTNLPYDSSGTKITGAITGLVSGVDSQDENIIIQPDETPAPQSNQEAEIISVGPEALTNETANHETAPTPVEENTSEQNQTPSQQIEKKLKTFSGLCEDTCNLSSLNLTKSSYKIRIEVNGVKVFIKDLTYKTSSGEQKSIQPLPEENKTQENTTEQIPINQTLNGEAVLQKKITLGQPVQWKKHITLDAPAQTTVTLPESADNILVEKISNGQKEDITENADIKTAEVNSVSGKGISSQETTEIKVTIPQSGTEYEVGYETPAPESVEENISLGKIVTIYAPTELNYTEVLSFTEFPESLKVKSENNLKLYWLVNGTKVEHPFVGKDTDNNSYIDYIEWTTPHLSNQTFEIIVITKAEHLDENRNFINDIYDSVKALDNNWSEDIPNGHYIRTTFEKNLTDKNDITVYAKSADNNSGTVEVYLPGSEEKITSIENINGPQYYKTYLTNLGNRSSSIFDLKILGTLAFDHIIDPPANQSGNNITACGTLDSAGTYRLNITLIPNTAATTACLNVTTNNVTINCNGFKIFNTTFAGIGITNANSKINISIVNCNITISNLATGILLFGTNNSYIYNNTVFARFPLGTSNFYKTIIDSNFFNAFTSAPIQSLTGDHNILQFNRLVANGTTNNTFVGDNNTLQYNNITGGAIGIVLDTRGRNNTLLGNRIMAPSVFGILLNNVTQNKIYNNTVGSVGQYPLYVNALSDQECMEDIINTTDLNTSREFKFYNITTNINDTTIMGAFFCNADFSVINNITIKNTTSLKNGGLVFSRTDNANVSNINASNAYRGILVTRISTKNKFYNLTINQSGDDGLVLSDFSDNNTFDNINTYINNKSGINVSTQGNNLNNITSNLNPFNGLLVGGPNNVIANITASFNVISGVNVINDSNNFTGIVAEHNQRDGILIDNGIGNNFYKFSVFNSSFISGRFAGVNVNGAANKTLLQNGFINSTRKLGIFLAGIKAVNITVKDTTLVGNTTNDITLNSYVINATFINVTYATENVSTGLANFANNSMIRQWYYQAFANFSNGTIANGSRLNFWDNDSKLQYNLTVLSTGFTPIINLTDYISNGTLKWFLSNYTINITWTNQTLTKSRNISADKNVIFDVFTFAGYSDTTPPGIVFNAQTIGSGANISAKAIYANVTLTEINFANITFFLWNSTGLYNSSFFTTQTYSINWTGLVDGNYTYQVNATDTWNNKNATEGRSILLDTLAPGINFTTPTEANNSVKTVDNIRVNVTGAENNYILNITIYLFNSSGGLINATATTTSPNFVNITGLANGIYYFNATVTDTSQNQNSTETRTVNISAVVSNHAPTIVYITPISATDPTEDGTVRITVNFTASDAEGFGDLNDLTADANFSKSGEALRQNTSCTKTSTFATTFANYSCAIDMWYFDGAGSWNITAIVADSGSLVAQNDTTRFTYNSFTGLAIGPSALTWASFSPGATNQSANNDPMLINNTGNTDIQNGNVSINATDLVGELNSNFAVYAANFTASIVGGSSLECNYVTNQTTPLFKGVFTNISNSTIPHGNHSINDNQTGQENLFYCIRFVGSELSAQPYSTLAQGSWTIKVLVVGLSLGGRRKKKKAAKADKLLQVLGPIIDELKEKHALSNSETVDLILRELEERYDLQPQEIATIASRKKTGEIPLGILTNDLGCLEALSKYMKENLHMNYSTIAQILARDDRTIWTSYKKAQQKHPDKFIVAEEDIYISLSIFKNSNLTTLESIVIYLKNKGMKYSKIATLLHRDQRNIWTTYTKAVKKMEKS